MPRYDFVCDTCRVIKEFTCSMSEATDPKPCPKCGEDMKRKFHPVRRVYRKHAGQFLDPDMNETQAEEALYQRIEETNE
jgi:putative FmdB family regulatory protein